MNFREVLNIDSSRLIADMVIAEIGSNPSHFQDVMNLVLEDTYPLSMRAARALQFAVEYNVDLIEPFKNQIIEIISNSKVDGVKRSFLKLLGRFINLQELDNLGVLVDLSLNLLLDTRQAVAIRYYCIEVLVNIMKIEPELKPELIMVFEQMVSEAPTSSMGRQCAKMLKMMKKQTGNTRKNQ